MCSPSAHFPYPKETWGRKYFQLVCITLLLYWNFLDMSSVIAYLYSITQFAPSLYVGHRCVGIPVTLPALF